jgi:hypothetical protein
MIPTPWVDCKEEGSRSTLCKFILLTQVQQECDTNQQHHEGDPEMAIGKNGLQHRNSFKLDYGSRAILAMSMTLPFQPAVPLRR